MKKALSHLLSLTLLLAFLFAPFGCLNAYHIYNLKQSIQMCLFS